MKIAILILSGAVLAGTVALLSAHRLSDPRVRAATEEAAALDRGATPLSRGPRPRAPRATHADDSPSASAGERAPSSAALPAAGGQPGGPSSAADTPATPAEAQAVEGDDVAAAKPAPRAPDAVRINPTSGEQMWSARDVVRDGGEADQPLCGGQRCRAGQFCCGPPACGHCAYPMAGPHCPGTCPGQKSN